MTKVNLYDFDHTIYNGDASLDFILYVILRDVRLWKYLPQQAIAVVYLIFGLQPRKNIKERAFRFLRDVRDVDALLERFWESHTKKLARWYFEKKHSSDIIISASPEFLLKPITNDLGVHLIGTVMDKKTGKIDGQNCRAEEKVKRLHDDKPGVEVSEAYSDSMSDTPILKLAEQGYIVSGNVLIKLEDYKPSKLKQLMSPAFLRFLFVGGLNAFLGIFFSFIISLFLDSPLLSFVLGFSLSLIISYFLNSVITFKNKDFSFRQFVSFCVSYIPNFLIQLICVHVLANILHFFPLVTYILAVVVAVPLTFLLLSNRTFKRKAQ